MKRLLSFALILVLMLSMCVGAMSFYAADFGCDVDTVSTAVYLENLDTGTVVYEENINEKMPPASLTKIMTYIVTVESIPDLENTKITVTQDALADLDPASSVMGLAGYIGEEFTVVELLYGLMLPSGNDAALVLADYVGNGNVSNFIDMMNRKAEQLSCKNTHFVNPHGLYDSMHYSTAADLAVIAKYASEKPYFKEITGTYRYDVPGMTDQLETTNYMIDPTRSEYYYSYVEGGKTGYTDEAGKCLMTTASKDGYRYLCITLGAPFSYADQINYAMHDTKALYTWAFDTISMKEVLSSTEVLRSLPVRYVWGDEFADLVPSGAVSALLPDNYDESLITTTVDLPGFLSAPVAKGEEYGTVTVYYDGELVGTAKIVSAEDIERDPLNYFGHCVINFVEKYTILVAIAFILFIFVLLVMISSHRNKKRRQARRRYR